MTPPPDSSPKRECSKKPNITQENERDGGRKKSCHIKFVLYHKHIFLKYEKVYKL